MTEAATFTPYEKYPTIQEARRMISELKYSEAKVPIKDLHLSISSTEKGKIIIDLDLNGQGKLPLSKGAIKSLSRKVGVSPRTYKEFISDPSLTSAMLKHSLNKRNEDIIVSHTEDSVLDFYSEKTVRIPPTDVFDLLCSRKELDRLQKLNLAPSGAFEFNFLTAEAKTPPRHVGEASHAGLYVLSNGKLEVGSYVYTLVCTNGMRTPRRSPAVVDIQAKDKLTERLSQLVETKIQESRDLLSQLMHLDDNDHIIEEPISYMAALMSRLRLGSRVISRLSEKLITLPKPCTAYDLVQFVTSEVNSSGNERYQDFGYKVLSSFKSPRCSHCASVVSNN